MAMKSVELNEEDSKEFVTLLEKDAKPEEIEAFLLDKSSGEVPAESVAALEKLAELDSLQETEIALLSKLATVRREIQGELVQILLDAGKDVKTDGALDESSDQAEETSPISTDQRTPS